MLLKPKGGIEGKLLCWRVQRLREGMYPHRTENTLLPVEESNTPPILASLKLLSNVFSSNYYMLYAQRLRGSLAVGEGLGVTGLE